MRINDVLKELIDKLVNYGYSIQSVYLTGSRLYGFPTEESDYDFKVYVYPSWENIALNRMVSTEVKINHPKCEKVDVKDLRYQYQEVIKPSFNSMHLLSNPVYGNKLFSDDEIEQVFTDNKRNLILSLLGTFRSRVKNESLKDFAHLKFLYSQANLIHELEWIEFNHFMNDESKMIADRSIKTRKGCLAGPNKDYFINQADSLFDEIITEKVEKENNRYNFLLQQVILNIMN